MLLSYSIVKIINLHILKPTEVNFVVDFYMIMMSKIVTLSIWHPYRDMTDRKFKVSYLSHVSGLSQFIRRIHRIINHFLRRILDVQ